jgi:predicted 3-demethylubiquinone-9 3-methyltransferase (glyoxalase superfamily)
VEHQQMKIKRENDMNKSMQKITPFLWFDNQAEEAVNFYTSIFNNSKVGTISRYDEPGAKVSGMPEGSAMTVSFELEGQNFTALNGGPVFTFSPAISFFVSCETPVEIDRLWEKLSEDGTVLMELDKYPFSEKFGWVNDKFGVSWQLNLARGKQKITPFLMFVGEQHGKVEEAMNFYTSLFRNSGITNIIRVGAGEKEPDGTIKRAAFSLNGQEFMAMESSREHLFTFTPAISFFVNCETQAEVDELWDQLSADKDAEQCGWLKDKYGVSWQIVPTVVIEMLSDPDPEKSKRVMAAVLQMKKIDIKTLEEVYEQ